MDEKSLRDYLRRSLTWHEAHVDWIKAVSGIPRSCVESGPKAREHSPWELLEHMRIATWDIYEFSRDAKHKSPKWPAEYRPQKPAPPNSAAWDKAVQALERDLEAMESWSPTRRRIYLRQFRTGQDKRSFEKPC